jgi:hypothetical protein
VFGRKEQELYLGMLTYHLNYKIAALEKNYCNRQKFMHRHWAQNCNDGYFSQGRTNCLVQTSVIYGGKEPFPVSDIHISIVEQPLEFIVLEKNRINFLSIILVEEKTDINLRSLPTN